MSHSGDQQPSLAPPVRTTGASMHQMEPRHFSGKFGEDVEEWLTHYKRVSKYNGWNSTAQLDNVVLFLTDTALVWFENHQDTFTTWDSFVTPLAECFGDSTTKRKRAEQILLQRSKVPEIGRWTLHSACTVKSGPVRICIGLLISTNNVRTGSPELA
ncbi:uncharacterized protein [Dermacentor albipictus]|uniref:uncharacterized protein isoform X3 n=1 Tax=Dermacentor albipictus TaxID=60249 RepID=UPI0038FC5024